MRRTLIATCIAIACLAGGDAFAKKPPPGRWQVSRTTDPITGSSTCIVAAFDMAGRTAFSRSGMLYPFVENNPVHGLLVGVSSGGRFRFPTGDIDWRIDDRPFRTIRAQDNPAPARATPPPTDVASMAMADAIALTTRLTMAATATSTVANGERAREMLDEMLAGHALLFRSAAAAASAYGLPTGGMFQVGQLTKDGPKPFPLDDSFRVGLTACGIAPRAADGVQP